MEATLLTCKQQLALLRTIWEERLRNFFKIEDPKFLQMVDDLLGDAYIKLEFKYRTNMDIASILFAWCLELGSKEYTQWVMTECVRDEWKYGMESFMAMAQNGNKEECCAEAQVGWEYINKYLRDREWVEQVFGSNAEQKSKKLKFKKGAYWLSMPRPEAKKP
ncbi:hypothetical protein SUGI_0088220 [Cryptomeria japonica]|nr:hypothetical protein SUGI_0088220 [Cryptomeria japonica]